MDKQNVVNLYTGMLPSNFYIYTHIHTHTQMHVMAWMNLMTWMKTLSKKSITKDNTD